MNDNVTPIDTAKSARETYADGVAAQLGMSLRELDDMAKIARDHERLLETMAEWACNEHRAREFRETAFAHRINANKCENLAYRLKQGSGSET